ASAAENALEPHRRRPDRVQPLGRRDARRTADRGLERESGFLGLVDSRWVLGEAKGDELRAELVQVAPDRRLLGDLDQRSDRDDLADARSSGDRLPLVVQREPALPVGLDQSPEMLAVAHERLPDVELVEASASSLPLTDESFDALTFTYLLRYVDDPGATLAELARVVRPGGTIAGLEFAVPRGIWRP